jgi:hypothetical protein
LRSAVPLQTISGRAIASPVSFAAVFRAIGFVCYFMTRTPS